MPLFIGLVHFLVVSDGEPESDSVDRLVKPVR